MSEHTFVDRDGVEVFYRTWPIDDAKAVVVIAHGASEHSGRYGRFARVLNEHGCAVYALDHRGHGVTARSTGPGRIGPGGGAGLVEDLHDLVVRAMAEQPGRPVFLFGHSMGSMITQAYVERYGSDLAAYVLSGCPGPVAGVDELRAGLRGAVEAGMGDEALDALGSYNEAYEPARTRFDWLSRDPEEVDRYVADPLCGDEMPLTYGFFHELVALSAPAMEPDGIAKTPAMPVLLITGEGDPVGAMGANVRELEQRLRSAGLEVSAHYYEGARHEALNETNRDEVHADVTGWLDSVLADGRHAS